ncbi:ABC transporter permease [Paenibacillus hodogayensis]|uniref:ABC transporter permease n=1 Tax=Paenibacillus hodogayensis TaxID=279208 RepID=A0ABV5VZP8_9BACL
MTIWTIAYKEIRSNLRDTRTFLFMLALPILLMLILGSALANTFSDDIHVGNLRLLVKSEATLPQLTAYWNGFAETIGKEGVAIEQASVATDGRDEVRANRYSAYAELDDTGIRLYGSSKDTIESNILQGMLTAFADRYSLAAAAFRTDPAAAQAIVASAGQPVDFIRETALTADKRPGSIDYYAVAMTTMIALYSAMSASSLFRGERTRNTAIRLMAAPISKGEIFLGKVIGCTFINMLCVIAVVLFSKFVFQADWGNHYVSVFLVLLTEVLLAVSLGLGMSFLIQGDGARSIIMIFTQIASFIGGAYFPIGDTEGVMTWISNLSPLRWANTALTQIIYLDKSSAAWPAIELNIGIAAVFLIIAVISMRRREAF